MRSKFLTLACAGMVFGMSGLSMAQNTNTNSNSNSNSNSGRDDSNSNRSNSNSNRGNSNRNSNGNSSNSNSNSNSRGNSNTSNSNDNSNMEMMGSTRSDSGTAKAAMGGAMDQKFAMDAAYSNNAEIASSQMALQKSGNPEIKRYAQMMIDHHTTANADLSRMANGMTLPTGLDPHHQAVADGHSKLSGMDFDMAYIKGQLGDHTMTLDMLETYKDKGGNKELKAYAKKTQPVVKEHLGMVKTIDMQMAAGMPMANVRENR